MKQKWKVLFILCLFLMNVFTFAEDFYLVKNGKSAASFEISSTEYKIMLYNFNSELRRSSGATLPISPKVQPDRNRILLRVIPDNKLETEDNFSYTFPDARTMEVKCTKRSLYWFLNYILEEYAGVTFLFNDKLGRSYRTIKDVKIPRKNYSAKPSFSYGRFTYLSNPGTQPWFYMKRGANCGHEQYIHCFPKEKYHKNNSYPMAIRPVINGKKLDKIPANPALYWQPCYSNPETARIAVENIFEYLRKKPETQSLSLTINDNGGFCECEECGKINGSGAPYNYSEVYFTWVKRVAEAVAKKYPDIQIVALAYSQVYQPCSFNLPDNVMIALCIDLYSVTDPAIMKKHQNIISAWSKLAKKLGVWDYSWGYPYFPPRMYLKQHVKMLRYLYQNGCRFYFGQCDGFNSKEGPKIWLLHKLLWNINADPEKLLAHWYTETAGEKAAPYLRKFYDFWEDYFQGAEVRKTPWFKSASATYMTGGDVSHIYGLKKGDLAKARSYLEKALETAETPAQKARIQKILHTYEYSEALMKLYAAEHIPPEGKITSAAQAAVLLKEIPSILPYQKIKREISKELEKDSWAGYYYRVSFRRQLAIDNDGTDAIISHLVMASEFLKDPSVASEFKKIAEDKKLPASVSKAAEVLSNPEKFKNQFSNGDLEVPLKGNSFEIYPGHRRKDSGIRSNQYKFTGNWSYQIKPGDYTLLFLNEKAKPDTFYLITLKFFMPESFPESFLEFAVYPAKNGRNQAYKQQVPQKFQPGKWHTITAFCQTRKDSNGVKAYLALRSFPLKALVYIDDIRLYEIEK